MFRNKYARRSFKNLKLAFLKCLQIFNQKIKIKKYTRWSTLWSVGDLKFTRWSWGLAGQASSLETSAEDGFHFLRANVNIWLALSATKP